jgi:hypothetical protein
MELSLVDKMTFEISGIEIDWAKKKALRWKRLF